MINNVSNNNKINDNYNKNINNRIERAVEFSSILKKAESQNELKISAHAKDRLKERNINFNDDDITNIRQAVEKIRSKGGKEALIIYNNVALLTSVKNNTIITAVDDKSMKENVFTNIDSAIII